MQGDGEVQVKVKELSRLTPKERKSMSWQESEGETRSV